MPFPNATAMTTPTCEASISTDVLEAARLVVAAHADCWQPAAIRNLSDKQRPLVLLLMALIDSAEAVARAIDDNAWDDGNPIDRVMTEGLASQAYRIGAVITNASGAHDTSNWTLPSMSGKELV